VIYLSKPFKTLDEQIDILIKRNLIIPDINEAKFLLTRDSYYSVINGYKGIFLKEKINQTDEDIFEDGTTLNDIISLHDFDKSIRNEILSVLEVIESTLSANIAYIFAERFGDQEEEYLKPENFKLGYLTRSGRYQREILLDNLITICQSNDHPMRHYREKHMNVPPWILVKGATFGNLVNIYKLFKKDEKEYLISRCLGMSVTEIDGKLKEFFNKVLDVLNRYRNWAAHGGRIYSHKVREELTFYLPAYARFKWPREKYNKGKGKSDILALCVAVCFFLKGDRKAYIYFVAGISYFLREYSKTNYEYYLKVVDEMGLPYNYEECFYKNADKSLDYDELLQNINSQNTLNTKKALLL
jgi:abortive infection bacteriophage resistance protein